MKACVFEEKGQVRYMDMPEPASIGPDEVLVRPKAIGICQSEYDVLDGGYIRKFSYPIIPGHEWSGVVEAVGDKVTELTPGDRVVGECVIGCGICDLCTSGQFTNCAYAEHWGLTCNGAMAEFASVPASALHKLPDALSFREGAMVEPFTCGYYAVYVNGGVDGGDTVAILGGGPIGQMTLVAAKGMGARAILVDPLENRRKIAERLGADATINPEETDVVEAVHDLTKGRGADLTVECAGVPAALKTVFQIASYGGRVSMTGIHLTGEVPVDLGLIQKKGLTVRGTIGSPYVWDRALRFLATVKPDLTPINTHQFPLEECNQAFDLGRDKSQCVKIQLTVP